MQNYRLLNHIVLWNVFFAIICIPTAGKLIARSVRSTGGFVQVGL